MYDLVIKNAGLVTFDVDDRIISNASIVINKGLICDILTA